MCFSIRLIDTLEKKTSYVSAEDNNKKTQKIATVSFMYDTL
jgi:hypothetical protein